MNGFMQIIVFLSVWIVGGLVFDALLSLRGGWLMSAGVVTFFVAGWAADVVAINWK